ncbi:MAG: nitroreductase family protein [Candidatus Micrarchaeota archaeon]
MINAIKIRRSVRLFKSTPVAEKDLEEIMRAALYAPSAADRRPVRYVIIREKETIQKLSEASAWSGLLKTAPLAIAVCADLANGKRWVEDCSIASEHIMLQSAELGLGTCWVQIRLGSPGKSGEPEACVKKLLQMPENTGVNCIIALGYPARAPKPHEDKDFDASAVYYEKYGGSQ